MKHKCPVPLLLIIFFISLVPHPFFAQSDAAIGPENGSLVIAGGNRLGSEIIDRFIELACGMDATIVVIPTAGGKPRYNEENSGVNMFRSRGVKDVTFLHTYNPEIADSEDFVKPLKKATGVWISGGRQWRLTDAYLNTRTHKELFNVLKRGGVIGGTSAGASVMATYMVRGAPEGNAIMMAEGHEEGFGFIRNVAIDQHLDKRNRYDDLIDVVRKYPHLLGIGLYESTAIVVQCDHFEVIGKGKVAIYDNTRTPKPSEKFYYLLDAGDTFDLQTKTLEKANN